MSQGFACSLLKAKPLLFILLYIYGVTSLLAQDTVRIAEVTVAAKSYREIIERTKLKGAELDQLRSHSVADAMRLFAGVQVKDYGGIGGIKTINVRSMGSQHVGVSYDGVQLSNVQNGQVDLGMFSLDNIEEVSLANGQRSEIFQTAKDFSLSSMVYLWSQRPQFADSARLSLKATYRGGSFSLVNPSARLDIRASDNIAATISAEHLRSDGKYRFRYQRQSLSGQIVYDTTAVRQNGDIVATRLEAGLYGHTNKTDYNLKAYHYQSKRGIPGAIVNNVWRRGERLNDNNTFVQGLLTAVTSRRHRTRNIIKWARYKTHYENNDSNIIAVSNNYLQYEAYCSTSHLLTINSLLDLSLAADGQWNSMEADLYGFVMPRRWTTMASIATSYSAHHGAGQLRAQASLVYNHFVDHTELYDATTRNSAWVPALVVSYSLQSVDIHAFAKRSYRMPTFNDLYYTDVGNSALLPERASQLDVGATAKLHALRLTLDTYYNRVHNKIVAYPKGTQFRWTMLNLGEVDIRGADANIESHLEPLANLTLTIRAQYTFQQSIDVTSTADSYYRHQIPYVPRHSGSLTARCQWQQWALTYSYIYTGERYSQQENTLANYVQPWYTSDMSLQRDVNLKNLSLRILAEANNLLNQSYDVVINYPMPGRNYRFTLTVKR